MVGGISISKKNKNDKHKQVKYLIEKRNATPSFIKTWIFQKIHQNKVYQISFNKK